MPELPDVQSFKNYVDSTSLHKTIKKVTVKDTAVLETSSRELGDALTGREFQKSHRHGKYLFLRANHASNQWLVMHFGMSGELKYFKSMQDQPAHTRVLFSFDNSYHLAYDCQRKLGRIGLTGSRKKFLEEKELGPDALEITWEEFRERLEGRRGMLKPALMNQKILAGIGNIYSDEILFHSGIHPKTKVKNLDENALRNVFENMKKVLATAVRLNADTKKFPQEYIIPHRNKGDRCPKGGKKLKRVKVSGRTAYYCPHHQKKP